MVPCPDVVSCIDSRFDCRNLLQRSVIHHGAEREASSAVISTPIQGVTTGTVCCEGNLAALPKIEAPALSPLRPGLLYWTPSVGGFIVAARVNPS